MKKSNLEKIEKLLGLRFTDPSLLEVAFTHSSYAFENDLQEHNERLEFLGDSVLGLVVTDFIFIHFPDLAEGKLAKLRANVVRAESLAEVAGKLGFGEFIRISHGAEQSGGRKNQSILGDCFEAVVGAIYLDIGYQAARRFVLENLQKKIFEVASRSEMADPKSALQELTMAKLNCLPEYRLVSEKGPAHSPTFTTELWIQGKMLARKRGTSKKRAEQAAADEALKKLSKELE